MSPRDTLFVAEMFLPEMPSTIARTPFSAMSQLTEVP